MNCTVTDVDLLLCSFRNVREAASVEVVLGRPMESLLRGDDGIFKKPNIPSRHVQSGEFDWPEPFENVLRRSIHDSRNRILIRAATDSNIAIDCGLDFWLYANEEDPRKYLLTSRYNHFEIYKLKIAYMNSEQKSLSPLVGSLGSELLRDEDDVHRNISAMPSYKCCVQSGIWSTCAWI